MILPQIVELPDQQRFLTLSRTTERPVFSMATQDRRLAISPGCEVTHADRIIYSRALDLTSKVKSAKSGLIAISAPATIADSAHMIRS